MTSGTGKISKSYGLRTLSSTPVNGAIDEGFGVYADVQLSKTATGVFGRAKSYQEEPTITEAKGVSGDAQYATNNIAIHGTATTVAPNNVGLKVVALNGSSSNYGVWAQATGTGANDWAGYFLGRLRISGDGYVNGNQFFASDVQFKTNINELTNGSQLIAQMNPSTYELMEQNHPHLQLPQGPQMGRSLRSLKRYCLNLYEQRLFPNSLIPWVIFLQRSRNTRW